MKQKAEGDFAYFNVAEDVIISKQQETAFCYT